MKRGDKGAEVRRVQEALIREGYRLPKYGADGDFGDETAAALTRFAVDRGIVWSQIDEAIAALDVSPPPPVLDLAPCADGLDIAEVIDITHDQDDPPWISDVRRNPKAEKKKKHRIVRGKVVKRNPGDVIGIVLHQTATPYSISNRQIKEAGGDRDKALHRRGLNIGCHAIAFEGITAGIPGGCGHLVVVNPLVWYVYHGNGFNSFTLGLEIEGDYPCKQGNAITLDPLIRAARLGVKYLMIKGRELGMPIEYVYAHRQSSDMRLRDPGEELWRKVALEYAVPVLGLKTDPSKTLGTGREIPIEWDPDGPSEC